MLALYTTELIGMRSCPWQPLKYVVAADHFVLVVILGGVGLHIDEVYETMGKDALLIAGKVDKSKLVVLERAHGLTLTGRICGRPFLECLHYICQSIDSRSLHHYLPERGLSKDDLWSNCTKRDLRSRVHS